jgi:Spy/CpxP family protein refolding chaperone
MKNRWIMIALVFSVAVNVAVIGTLIYYWSHQHKDEFTPPNFRDMQPPKFDFGLDQEQREQMHLAMQEHRQCIKEIIDSLRIHRHAIMELLLSGEQDQTVIDKAIEKTVPYQIELERATVRHLLAMRPILGNEQWQRLVQAIEFRMPHDGMRRFMDRPRFDQHRRFNQPDTIPHR